jgi:hypothetical protein
MYIPASLLHFQRIIFLFLFRERTVCPHQKRKAPGFWPRLGHASRLMKNVLAASN